MYAANPDVVFKTELLKALNQLGGNWENEAAAAAIQPVLRQYHMPFYLLDHKIMKELGVDDYRHIYVSIQTKRSPIQTKDYHISFLIQRNPITNDNILPLQLLDIILLFQRGDELQPNSLVNGLRTKIDQLTYQEQKMMIQLARKYPVSTRAFLGLLLANLNRVALSAKALQTLNPVVLTRYKKAYRWMSNF